MRKAEVRVVARESWCRKTSARSERVLGVFVGLLHVSKRRGFCGMCGRIVRCASVCAHFLLGRVSLEFETRTVFARSGKRSRFAIERWVGSCALCLAMRGTCALLFMPSSRLERKCCSQLEPFWRVRVFFPHSARPGVWWPNARSSGFARLAFSGRLSSFAALPNEGAPKRLRWVE